MEFGPNQGVVWKTALSRGNSSPVTAGERILLTGAEGAKRITFALDRGTGKILWRREIKVDRREALHKLNDPASPTPVTDGANVYVFFGDFGLASYGPDVNERWRMPPGPFTNLHGMAASPVLAGSTLLMNCDQDYHAFAMGIDKETGKVRWKADRSYITHGFSTPVLYRDQVIVPGSYQMVAYSVSMGEKVWWVRDLTWQPKSAPVIAGDVLYFNGWTPGGDPGEQKELPPWNQVPAECDANKDGTLSREEVCPPYRHGGS